MSSEEGPALIAAGAVGVNALGPGATHPQNPDADFRGKPQLDYDAWRHSLQKECARYNPEGVESGAFKGWIRSIDICGFKALDAGWNAGRLERDGRDARLDGVDHYFVLTPLSGPLLVTQNERATRLAIGDVVLLDATRPQTLQYEHELKEPLRHLALNLPRQELAAHLGFEPQGGLARPNGTSAGRLLFELIQNTSWEPASNSLSSESYMRLVVYDLIGALFSPPDRSSGSRYADKLFARVWDIVRQGYADPDFGPPEAAARAGISLRYLQKLFTQRDATCSDLIYSLRLDRAAQLLRRRESVRSDQPLSDIAYACGFHDYTHFARRFRHRFGHPPGAHPAREIPLRA
jgi:AraC-like DNA-binding protein